MAAVGNLQGRLIASFESRRSTEMGTLVQRQGGEVLLAPAMQEVPLREQPEATAFAEVLLRGQCDVLVLLTGVGTRMLLDAMALRHDRDALVAAIGRAALVCRGPKPVAFLKELGLRPRAVAPEPNTYRELLSVVRDDVPLAGQRVYVQEYGVRNQELLDGLEALGPAQVVPVPIYAWSLPDDLAPLEGALRRVVGGEVDAALFTSQQQVENLMEVARRLGLEPELLGALRDRTVVASVGPITTEALTRHGVPVDFEPEHPKMGPMVVGLGRALDALLAAKSRQASG